MVENKEAFGESVARRAYELYVERGANPGSEVEDWLRAEKELSEQSVTHPAESDKVRSKASGATDGPRPNKWPGWAVEPSPRQPFDYFQYDGQRPTKRLLLTCADRRSAWTD